MMLQFLPVGESLLVLKDHPEIQHYKPKELNGEKECIRRVSFSDVLEISQYKFELKQKSDLWYSSEDFQEFRSSLMKDAKQVSRSDKSVKGAILHVFTKCRECPTTVVDKKQVSVLGSLFIDGRMIGLEKWVSRDVVRDKALKRRAQWKCVQEIQNMESLSEEQRSLLIRTACESISSSSTTFSRYLGSAVAARSA